MQTTSRRIYTTSSSFFYWACCVLFLLPVDTSLSFFCFLQFLVAPLPRRPSFWQNVLTCCCFVAVALPASLGSSRSRPPIYSIVVSLLGFIGLDLSFRLSFWCFFFLLNWGWIELLSLPVSLARSILGRPSVCFPFSTLSLLLRLISLLLPDFYFRFEL